MGRNVTLGTLGDIIRDIERRLRTVERGRFRAPVVGADPSAVGVGDVWIRSDTGQLCWHDGTQIRRVTGT